MASQAQVNRSEAAAQTKPAFEAAEAEAATEDEAEAER